MKNQFAIDKIQGCTLASQRVLPDYGGFCFSGIPRTIERYFGFDSGIGDLPLPSSTGILSSQEKPLIALFLDGLGISQFESILLEFPKLSKLINEGVYSPITSQFPSTTSAHMTTFCTGLPVYETGIYEWYYYEPKVGTLISPLVFHLAGDKKGDSLLDFGIEPSQIYPKEMIWNRLAEKGVSSQVYLNEEIVNSPVSKHLFKGAQRHSFKEVYAGFELLKSQLRSRERQLHFLYFVEADSISHRYGPNSEKALDSWRKCFRALENFLTSSKQKFSLMLFSDHGHVEIDKARSVFLESVMPVELLDPKIHYPLIQRGNKDLFMSAGSVRDLFLHCKEGCLEEVKQVLKSKLSESYIILDINEMCEIGLFGPSPSKALLERIGDIGILPKEGYAIWWEGKSSQVDLLGGHGGDSYNEMVTPFIWLNR